MADMAMELSDEQIDRLLSEAETRLTGQRSSTTITSNPNKALLPAGSGTVNSTTELPKEQEQAKLSKDLSVRVPELKNKLKAKDSQDDAGADWFNMPRTSDDPKVKRDLQVLKLRNVLALGKQHFKKDSRKDPIPKFSQMGTLVEGPTDFYSARLTRKERKRTLVEEVLASHNSLSKFKTKYNEIQERSMSGRKAHYKKMSARRKRR